MLIHLGYLAYKGCQKKSAYIPNKEIRHEFLATMQYYFIHIREMPTGRGFADYVFLPKPEYREEMPALLVELKWNKSANTAAD